MSVNPTTEQRVLSIFKDQLGLPETPDASANLFDDLQIDSLDIVELSIYIEDEFDIEIRDDILEDLNTVQQFIDYVESA